MYTLYTLYTVTLYTLYDQNIHNTNHGMYCTLVGIPWLHAADAHVGHYSARVVTPGSK